MGEGVYYMALIILFLPLAGGLLALIKDRVGMILLTICTGAAAFCALLLVINNVGQEVISMSVSWFQVGGHSLDVGVLLDRPALIMTLVVTLITFLVSLFSLVYMADDPGRTRYFATLGFFATCMLGIVMASNLLMIFFFWELVGFSSYLLINHYFTKDAASSAAMKAFIVNRIGDVGFVIALALVWAKFGTFDLAVLSETVPDAHWAIGLCLFLGVIGKSAQFPLQVWLPDAMEGPTPASALIHAATMVAAGVYLLSRTLFLFDPVSLDVIAFTGAITAFMGAVAAISQFDIKKVLAYSTISQLGYMVMGMGVEAKESAMSHLFSHAFFKAGLFLAAGSIIHALHKQSHDSGISYDVQDMRMMGGLKKNMPWTFTMYLVFSAALIGLPLTSGFLTKDAILTAAVSWLGGDYAIRSLVPLLGIVTVALTAYYMLRQLILVFWGNTRTPGAQQAQTIESSWLMRIPLIILGLGSLWLLWSVNPLSLHDGWLYHWIYPASIELDPLIHLWISALALAMILIGGIASWWMFRCYENQPVDKNTGFLDRLSMHNWWLDDIYEGLIVTPVKMVAGLAGKFESLVLDRIINLTGILYVLFSHIVAWIDKRVVDGAVHFIAGTARATGSLSASMARGSVQYYLWLAVFIALAVLWVLI